jgi:sensor domain CHASE-containing protein
MTARNEPASEDSLDGITDALLTASRHISSQLLAVPSLLPSPRQTVDGTIENLRVPVKRPLWVTCEREVRARASQSFETMPV